MVIYTSARYDGTSGGCLQLNFIVLFVQATMLLMFLYIYICVFEGIISGIHSQVDNDGEYWGVCPLAGGNGIYV